MTSVRVVLISTYDLGRQPLGLASPAAWLRREGIEVDCVDTSRDALEDVQIQSADLVAFYLPMHTATRLAAPLVARVRTLNPDARLAAYGLYAPLNAAWLREQGVTDVLGPEAEAELLALANQELREPKAESREPRAKRPEPGTESPEPKAESRESRVLPDRSTLPALSRYAALQMPDGTRRVVGSTDATRGCKHLCRHCPIVPVYEGRFKATPIDSVIDDIRTQVDAGAQHISFGDPDFLNGPTHARRLIERVAREFPELTYDVTIKIEHLLRHEDMLPLLRETGCLMVTSAVESVDDEVLEKLRKGHTRADFAKAVELCRQAAVTLTPTFVPFTPWTTLEGYRDLLDQLEALDLTRAVAPIQLAIRLLVTAESKLLELSDIQSAVEPFDAESLTFPWRHQDARVDTLQRDVMRIVSEGAGQPRDLVFDRIAARTREAHPDVDGSNGRTARTRDASTPPYMTEAWYCCAEPGPELSDLV